MADSAIPEECEIGENNRDGPSLEELQARLAEMEATQTELADRLKMQSETGEPQLDHHLAVIEEQFRRSFDDRLRSSGDGYSTSSSHSTSGRSAIASGRSVVKLDPSRPEADVLLVNRVFRDASRLMGDEWRQVYDGLTAGFPPEVVDNERDAIGKQPSLIQGYKALLSWKDLSGEEFDFRQLIDVLRNCDMHDVADTVAALAEGREVKDDSNKTKSKQIQRRKSDLSSRTKSDVLDNRRMLLLAKKIGADWLPVGKALGVSDEELNDIQEGPDGSTYQGAFKMLWAWRQSQTSNKDETSLEILRQALNQVNKGQLADQLAA